MPRAWRKPEGYRALCPKRIFFCSSVIGLRSSAPSAWPRFTAGRAPAAPARPQMGKFVQRLELIADTTQPQQAMSAME